MKRLTRNGTNGRVYGGDCELIHVRDGHRGGVGRQIAAGIDETMRLEALASGTRTWKQASEQLLCPGCYMIVGFNALVHLAQKNGQPLHELGATMEQAFRKLRESNSPQAIEEILIILER